MGALRRFALKKKDSTLNMTEGNTVGLLLTFAFPMLIGNVFQQFYNLIDSVIVGKLVGADALAAIGATNSITFLFFALCNGIGNGGGIITSQNYGRGDIAGVKKCITNTFYLMVAFPIIVGLLGFIIVGNLLTMLDTPADIIADSITYARIMCIGVVFVSLYNFISSMLRALGDSKTPLYFLIFSCILNTVLDYIFVKFLGLSIMGAGIATLIAQFVSGFVCILYALKKNPYFKFEREDLSLDWSIIWKTVRLGVPLSLQFSLIAISCMALQKVVNSFGAVAVAAFTATSRIEQLVHQPYQTLGASLSTFTGQNYGASKHKRVIEGYRKSMLMMAIFSILMLPIMQFFGREIISLFVSDEPVIAMGAQAIRISSWCYIFLGTIYTVRGVLNGIGDAFFSLINGVVEVVGRFTIPIALISIPFIGVWGIWGSVGIVWFLAGFTAWLRYVYMKKKVLNTN